MICLYLPLFSIFVQERPYDFTFLSLITIHVLVGPYLDTYPNAYFYDHICNA